MSMVKSISLCAATLLATLSLSSMAQHERRGVPVSDAQLQEFDQIVTPDGAGLPAGQGTAADGEVVYNMRCQACHGAKGEGANPALQLVGGDIKSPGTPVRTIGSFWPYATTIFDYVRRAMPADAPKSLSNVEVYQVTAYLLYLNEIVSRDFVVDKDSLPRVAMPNKNGFVDQSHIQ